MSFSVIRQRCDLAQRVQEWKQQGHTVAVVPTMGALHLGHMELVAAALRDADRVIVTLFVNPKQFNEATDLQNYPRTEAEDAAKVQAAGAHMLYVPDLEEMYPKGFATNVSVSGVSEGLCGAHRPGHFDGVATVVTKLLLQSGANKAYFGEKDYQQLAVIRRFVRDLDIPVTVQPVPTVREADGLAMSSRNVHLSPEQRAAAPALIGAMLHAAHCIQQGQPVAKVLADAREQICAAGFAEVDYLELRAADDLTPLSELDREGRLLAAARLGATRLIDNIAVPLAH
ncbi:pantoate--beta-alanine ligase [Polycladidibacter hongkongensis]|uniref:pantoate--beta-alanine ligase n=1 Tax=Polycladidibacter hongkongensis TaxID=1647556 RepID=UPI000830BA34|nr:pantoate--beta-alanine ligase [Pseudovibrio hongkongensis]